MSRSNRRVISGTSESGWTSTFPTHIGLRPTGGNFFVRLLTLMLAAPVLLPILASVWFSDVIRMKYDYYHRRRSAARQER